MRLNLGNDKVHTALDLLQLVRQQQVSNMRYETLGFRKIVRECTAWPYWTHFGSIVQHQNLGIKQRVRLGGANLSAPSAVVLEGLARAFLNALYDLEKCLESPDMEVGRSVEVVWERIGGLKMEGG